MGQLEVYGIHEIYLIGIIIGIFLNYAAEEEASETFESFKPYFYSVCFISKKLKILKLMKINVLVNNGGVFKSFTVFNTRTTVYNLTKFIDELPIWQDLSLVDFKSDEHVLKVQQRFSW